jgi:hypothetical protein
MDNRTTGGPGQEQTQRELAVFVVGREAQCAECGQELWRGDLLRAEGGKVLCLACADLDHLEFLPAGDPAITRRASRYSRLRAVVLKWSRARKRHERQGLLVEPAAMERAEEESLADAEVRARRRERAAIQRAAADQEFIASFARAIRARFPHCPPGEEDAIAAHACRKHSGRVGRTAAAKALSPEAVTLAVIAHIRHAHTPYDELLGSSGDRDLARAEVRAQVEEILRRWQG